MDNPIVRGIVAVLAGVIAGFIVVGVMESIGHLIFPPPEGLDLTNPEDMERLMQVIPLGAKIAVVIAWFFGALAGSIVAMMIGKRALPAWIVTALIIAAGLFTTQMFPHPMWMVIAAIALPLLATLLAKRLMMNRISP